MVNIKSFLHSITLGINRIANPAQGFTQYINQSGYKYYYNFIDYAFTKLLVDFNLEEHINNGTFEKWGLRKETIELLARFADHLDKYYQKNEKNDDFTLFRDNYWDIFTPEAKKCVEALEKDIAMMKD
jgi:hypothetical protein